MQFFLLVIVLIMLSPTITAEKKKGHAFVTFLWILTAFTKNYTVVLAVLPTFDDATFEQLLRGFVDFIALIGLNKLFDLFRILVVFTGHHQIHVG